MTIQDSVPITTLERAVSTDITISEDLINRSISEIARAIMSRRVFVNRRDLGYEQFDFHHVASGLVVVNDNPLGFGASLIVEPGVLFQMVPPNPSEVPAPDVFDSDYRFGILHSRLNVGNPWNGVTRYWLLEGRVVRETTLSEQRDIFNPALGTFAPSGVAIDKRYESRIEFQWTEGTATDYPVPSLGWAPIGGVFLTGASVLNSRIAQFSIQYEDLAPFQSYEGRPVRHSTRMRSSSGIGANSAGLNVNLDAEINGIRAYVEGYLFGKVDEFIPVADAAALAVRDVWGYVYVGPGPNDMQPSNMYSHGPSALADPPRHRGVVVISRVTPDEWGRNSVAITLPSPLNQPAMAGTLTHVGCVRCGTSATTWRYVDASSHGEARCEISEFNADVGAGGSFPMTEVNQFQDGIHALDVTGAVGTEDVPWGVHLKIGVDTVKLDIGAMAVGAEVVFRMAGDSVTEDRYPRVLLSFRTITRVLAELYPPGSTLSMFVEARAVDADLVTQAWSVSTVGGNEFRGYLWGWRF